MSNEHIINDKEKAQNSIIQALTNLYLFGYYIDIHSGCYVRMEMSSTSRKNDSDNTHYQDERDWFLEHIVTSEYRERIAEFTDISTIEERLRGQSVIFEDYINYNGCWVRCAFIPADYDENGHLTHVLFIGQNIDVSRRKELKQKNELHELNERLIIANARLQQACAEAELANIAKTDFLARMSHDIRTPLNGILGLLEIAGKCSDDHEKVESCRQKAIVAANHLLSLLNDVLDMSKLESGDIRLTQEPFNMNDLLFQTHEIMSGQMAVKNIKNITTNRTPLPHPNVIGSPVHVRQILTNLISNAIKYNRQGGSIYASMEETAIDDDNITFLFTISDTGIGMTEEFLQHIFEPFARENEKLNSKVTGTGLGMSIVKKLIDKMNGTIEIESTKDVGSTFKVTLPFKRDKQHISGDTVPSTSGMDLKGIRLLLVEDNELNCEVAQYLLTDEGAIVDVAPNGQIAVDVFSQSPAGYYDVILMDMMMPVLDGCSATRVIRSLERNDAANIPIIALTANAFSDDVSRCHEAGMNAHLSKPLDINATIKTIRYYTGI